MLYNPYSHSSSVTKPFTHHCGTSRLASPHLASPHLRLRLATNRHATPLPRLANPLGPRPGMSCRFTGAFVASDMPTAHRCVCCVPCHFVPRTNQHTHTLDGNRRRRVAAGTTRSRIQTGSAPSVGVSKLKCPGSSPLKTRDLISSHQHPSRRHALLQHTSPIRPAPNGRHRCSQ